MYYLLVLPLTFALSSRGLPTNLINGYYKYKPSPLDGPRNGFTQYYALWGLNSTMTDVLKQNPLVKHHEIKEDNSGMIMRSLPEAGEPIVVDMTWNKWISVYHPILRKNVRIFPRLIAPNTVKIIYKINEDGLTDLSILRYTETGFTKSSVATKSVRGSRYKYQSAAWTGFEERVDRNGKPAPL